MFAVTTESLVFPKSNILSSVLCYSINSTKRLLVLPSPTFLRFLTRCVTYDSGGKYFTLDQMFRALFSCHR